MFSIFKNKKKLNNLEKAVIYIFKNDNGSLIGTSFNEISFSDIKNELVMNDILHTLDLVTNDKDVSWREVGEKRENIEFELIINKKQFDVHVSKEPDRKGGAILRVRESEDWLDELYTWLLENMAGAYCITKFFLPHQSTLILGAAHAPEYRPSKQTILPEGIGKLTNLKILGLINGNITTLPMSISKMTNLEELKLGGNALTKLPAAVCNLPNLKILTLWMNGIKQWPNEVGNLLNLEGLDISWNDLLSLPDYFIKLTKLKRLYMFGNEDLIFSEPQKRWIVDLIKNGAEVLMEKDKYDQLLREYPVFKN